MEYTMYFKFYHSIYLYSSVELFSLQPQEFTRTMTWCRLSTPVQTPTGPSSLTLTDPCVSRWWTCMSGLTVLLSPAQT